MCIRDRLSRDRLEQHLWNYDYAGGSNVIDVYIRYLRKKICLLYTSPFEMDHATVVTEGNTNGNDVAIIACGEMVKPAKDAARLLKAEGISASVLDMYCIKPLDEEAIVRMAGNAKAVLTAVSYTHLEI